jgi:type IV pilus assembly protein PilO
MNSVLAKWAALEPQQRWLVCGLVVFLIGGVGYYLHAANLQELDTLSTEVREWRQSVEKYRAVAARHEALKAQLAALDEALQLAATLLPETREIPELLTQISQLGLQVGLEFRLFKPEPEKRADFFAEVPVSLAILGRFHDVARFFDQLSKLPRIVNVTDIKIAPATKEPGAEPTLSTQCLVTTFRFLEPSEADVQKGGRGQSPGKGR